MRRRVVRQVAGLHPGKLYIETPRHLWWGAHALHMAGPDWPDPMPRGHGMFEQPGKWQCERVTEPLPRPAKLRCGCVPGYRLCPAAKKLWSLAQTPRWEALVGNVDAGDYYWEQLRRHYADAMPEGAGWPAQEKSSGIYRVGKKAAGQGILDGVEHQEWP